MAPEFVVSGIVSGSSVGMIVNDFDALHFFVCHIHCSPGFLVYLFSFGFLPGDSGDCGKWMSMVGS